MIISFMKEQLNIEFVNDNVVKEQVSVLESVGVIFDLLENPVNQVMNTRECFVTLQ